MAARTRSGTKALPWADETRSRIQTSMLVNRLQDFIKDDEIELDANRIRAIEILLSKALPNLAQIESHNTNVVQQVAPTPLEDATWAEKHGAATDVPAGETVQ